MGVCRFDEVELKAVLPAVEAPIADEQAIDDEPEAGQALAEEDGQAARDREVSGGDGRNEIKLTSGGKVEPAGDVRRIGAASDAGQTFSKASGCRGRDLLTFGRPELDGFAMQDRSAKLRFDQGLNGAKLPVRRNLWTGKQMPPIGVVSMGVTASALTHSRMCGNGAQGDILGLGCGSKGDGVISFTGGNSRFMSHPPFNRVYFPQADEVQGEVVG